MNGFSLVIASKIDFFKINKYELVKATFISAHHSKTNMELTRSKSVFNLLKPS